MNYLCSQSVFCNLKNLQAIRAELIGSDSCSAVGITARGMTPVLALCRRLIEAGNDPATPLEVWRGSTLCLRIRRIGGGRSSNRHPEERVSFAVPAFEGGRLLRQPSRPFPQASRTMEPTHEAARQSSGAATQAARGTPLARQRQSD